MSETQATLDEPRFSEPPENACIHYERCGNTAPVSNRGISNGICDGCLDRVRHEDRGWQDRGYDTYPEWLEAKLSE